MAQSKYKIKEIPIEKRPREKLIESGPDALTDAELLAIVLNTGLWKKNYYEDVLKLSNRILKEYGSKTIVNEKNVEKLMKNLEIPKVKASQIVACFELGRRFFKEDEEEIYIRDSKDAYNYLKDKIANLRKEQFRGLYLNSRNKLIYEEVISLGTLTTNLVHPREVFQPAIQHTAVAIVLAHNHPSGDPESSEDDIKITQQLIDGSLNPAYIPILSNFDISLLKYCEIAIENSKKIAEEYLKNGMLKEDQKKAEQTAKDLAYAEKYTSHAHLIDRKEAASLFGEEDVEYIKNTDPLWNLYWELYCRSALFLENPAIVKLFETENNSVNIRIALPQVR